MAIFTSLSKWIKDPLDVFSIKTNKILYELCLKHFTPHVTPKFIEQDHGFLVRLCMIRT